MISSPLVDDAWLQAHHVIICETAVYFFAVVVGILT
jgi:hypothetical protein